MLLHKSRKKIDIRGVVQPFSEDHDGNVSGIMLCAQDGRDYVVVDNDKGLRMTALLDYEVEVEGFVEKIDGRLHLTVRNFWVLDHPVEDSYEWDSEYSEPDL